ncbi:uracil-DNA glycosylase [bacterium]|nr:uracil-DNA glycosylase [bacterium]
MSDLPELIEATIQALEEMKRDGVTHVDVAPATLAALSRPVAPAGAGSLHGVATVEDWQSLEQEALACQKCKELAGARHQVVFGVGDQRAELLFIGEAPGRDEDLKGEPFVGRAGELLTKIIQAMGFQRHQVYIANVLKCRPPENRTPLPEEVANCQRYLEKQIELIQPRAIVALGATALRALLDVQLGITKMRGTWYTYRGIPIMPTFHPAYLLRNPAAKRDVWQDMQAVVRKLGREVPGK